MYVNGNISYELHSGLIKESKYPLIYSTSSKRIYTHLQSLILLLPNECLDEDCKDTKELTVITDSLKEKIHAD